MVALSQAKWEMIEASGRTAQSFGLNRLLGQIYMSLYLAGSPQSLDFVSWSIREKPSLGSLAGTE